VRAVFGRQAQDDPLARLRGRDKGSALVVLRGNLAPDGAVMKGSAASQKLMNHAGPAVVFGDTANMKRVLDNPDLAELEGEAVILRYAGPVGAPGMPEWGNLPVPKSLLLKGVRDVLRISDAWMSGTHYGTSILHVAPEAAEGGPLALVRSGTSFVWMSPPGGLDMLVDDADLARRRAALRPKPSRYDWSYARAQPGPNATGERGRRFRLSRASPSPTSSRHEGRRPAAAGLIRAGACDRWD